MYKVIICGSRSWPDPEAVRARVVELKTEYGKALHLILGGARGPDTDAEEAARDNGVSHEVERPNYELYGRRYAPLTRNLVMVNKMPDEVIGFLDRNSKTKGAFHCCDAAERKGIKVTRIYDPAT